MNLILLTDNDFISASQVRLNDRRAEHIRTVHRADAGEVLLVGLIGGKIGYGTVEEINETSVSLAVTLEREPPKPLDLKLFLALPRPKYLARCLQTATSLGVKQIYLMNSYRVEKMYWSCAQLAPAEINRACLLGLEQARDTVLPTVHMKRLFKPFVEDELPALIAGTTAVLAHPSAPTPCPFSLQGETSLAIGPEGGFIDYEVQKLKEIGFQAVHTFERILKVETALASLIGRLK